MSCLFLTALCSLTPARISLVVCTLRIFCRSNFTMDQRISIRAAHAMLTYPRHSNHLSEVINSPSYQSRLMHCLSKACSAASLAMPTSSSLIDLFQGWPSPDLLPISLLKTASRSLLASPRLSVPSLLYGPDAGPPSLRDALAPLLAKFYSSPWTSQSRLTATGGASQGLACILQVFSDPLYTQNVYMVAPTYFLACRVFEDHGFVGRLKAVPEDDEGIDINRLEELISADDLTIRRVS